MTIKCQAQHLPVVPTGIIYIINIYILYIMLTYCVLYVYKQICVKVNARRAGSTHWRLEKHKTPSDILQMKR